MGYVSVYIADDYYKAYICLAFDDLPLTTEDALAALHERNVVYGIDMTLLETLCKKKEDVVDVLIAIGQPHIHGVNSEIIHLLDSDQGMGHPKLLEDGTVDFKSLGLLQKVDEDQVLATKIPAAEGMDGVTVTGKVIHARNGKDLRFEVGENAIVSEDGLSVRAACGGVYNRVGEKITVQQFLEFNDGIGVHTGNVNFKGDIFISGNVIDGYAVICDGNLTINGVVEGAHIDVTGDLTISKGVTGHDISKVFCGGNLVTKFLDNAEVIVHGNLEAEEIVNCHIMCDGEVKVKGKKGHIVGGEITAKYAINAKQIGSRLGVITLINLGVSLESVNEFKQLKSDLLVERENSKKLQLIIDILGTKEKKGIISEDEHVNLLQCYENLEKIKKIIAMHEHRINELRDLFKKAKLGQVKTESIYPDTLVRIGKSTYFIDEAVLRSIIKKSGDEIVAISF